MGKVEWQIYIYKEKNIDTEVIKLTYTINLKIYKQNDKRSFLHLRLL